MHGIIDSKWWKSQLEFVLFLCSWIQRSGSQKSHTAHSQTLENRVAAGISRSSEAVVADLWLWLKLRFNQSIGNLMNSDQSFLYVTGNQSFQN